LINDELEDAADVVKVGGQLVQAVRFADDQAMLASSNLGLQRIMDKLNATSEEYGMKIKIYRKQI